MHKNLIKFLLLVVATMGMGLNLQADIDDCSGAGACPPTPLLTAIASAQQLCGSSPAAGVAFNTGVTPPGFASMGAAGLPAFNCGIPSTTIDVFSFVGNGTVTTLTTSGAANGDHVLQVHAIDFSADPCNPTVSVAACDDDAGGTSSGFNSAVSFNSVNGTQYIVAVSGWGGGIGVGNVHLGNDADGLNLAPPLGGNFNYLVGNLAAAPYACGSAGGAGAGGCVASNCAAINFDFVGVQYNTGAGNAGNDLGLADVMLDLTFGILSAAPFNSQFSAVHYDDGFPVPPAIPSQQAYPTATLFNGVNDPLSATDLPNSTILVVGFEDDCGSALGGNPFVFDALCAGFGQPGADDDIGMSADNIYNTPVSINLNTILAANPNGGTVLVAIPGTPITMVFDLDVTNQACYPGGLAGDIVLDDNVICNNEFLNIDIVGESDIVLADQDNNGVGGYGVDVAIAGNYNPFDLLNAANQALYVGTLFFADDLDANSSAPQIGPFAINNPRENGGIFGGGLSSNVLYFAVGYTFDDSYSFTPANPADLIAPNGCNTTSFIPFMLLDPITATKGHCTCLNNGTDGTDAQFTVEVTLTGGSVLAAEVANLKGGDLETFAKCVGIDNGGSQTSNPGGVGGVASYNITGIGVSSVTLTNILTGNVATFNGDATGSVTFNASIFDVMNVTVVDAQSWSLTVTDAAGCSAVVGGVCDEPDPDFTGLLDQFCQNDPTSIVYDEALFEAGFTKFVQYCDNGICEPAQGEDATTCPFDCPDTGIAPGSDDSGMSLVDPNYWQSGGAYPLSDPCYQSILVVDLFCFFTWDSICEGEYNSGTDLFGNPLPLCPGLGPVDIGANCGNGVCDCGETNNTCPGDCTDSFLISGTQGPDGNTDDDYWQTGNVYSFTDPCYINIITLEDPFCGTFSWDAQCQAEYDTGIGFFSGAPIPGCPGPGPVAPLPPVAETAQVGTFYFNNDAFDPALVNNGDGTAVFDPFNAGPGQHLVSYCFEYGDRPGYFDECAGPNADNCVVCADQLVSVYPEFNPVFAAPKVVCSSTEGIELNLADIANILNTFDALETIFDANTQIDEEDFFIRWSGPGVWDLNDGNNFAVSSGDGTGAGFFDPTYNPGDPAPPGAGATATPPTGASGLGVHTIMVEVGYPSCVATYAFTVTVVNDVDATINDRALCAMGTDETGMVDLNVLLENTTVQGGTFNVTSATDADGADILGGDVQQNSTILTYDTDGNLPFTINVCYEFGCPDWDTDNDGDVDIFDFDLDSEDVNQNGVCDPGEDVNGNGVLDGIIDDTEALAILNSECGYALAAGIIPDANNDGVVDDEDLETLYPNTNGYMVQITTANIDTQSFTAAPGTYTIFPGGGATLVPPGFPDPCADPCGENEYEYIDPMQLLSVGGSDFYYTEIQILPSVSDPTLDSIIVSIIDSYTVTNQFFHFEDMPPAVGPDDSWDVCSLVPFPVDQLVADFGGCYDSDCAVLTIVDSPITNFDAPECVSTNNTTDLSAWVTVTASDGTELNLTAFDSYSFSITSQNAGNTGTVDATTGVYSPGQTDMGLVTFRFTGANAPGGVPGFECEVIIEQVVSLVRGGVADIADAPEQACAGDGVVVVTVGAGYNTAVSSASIAPAGPGLVWDAVAGTITIDFSATTEVTTYVLTFCTGENTTDCSAKECDTHAITVYPVVSNTVSQDVFDFFEGDAYLEDLDQFVTGTPGGYWVITGGSAPEVNNGEIVAYHKYLGNNIFDNAYDWDGNAILVDDVDGIESITLCYVVGFDGDWDGDGTPDGPVNTTCYASCTGAFIVDPVTITINVHAIPDAAFNCPPLDNILCEGQGTETTAGYIDGCPNSRDLTGAYNLTAHSCTNPYVIFDETETLCGNANIPTVVTVNLTGIPPQATIIDYKVYVSYTDCNNQQFQGDVDHLFVTDPSGNNIFDIGDNQGPGGAGNDKFDITNIENCTVFDNNPATPGQNGQCANPLFVFDPTNLVDAGDLNFSNCLGASPAFTYTALSHADDFEVSLRVYIYYKIDDFDAFTSSETTSNQGNTLNTISLPYDGDGDACADTGKDVSGGVYTAVEEWVDPDGETIWRPYDVFNAVGLEEFTEIQICHTVYGCDAIDLNGDGVLTEDETAKDTECGDFFINNSFNGTLGEATLCEGDWSGTNCGYDLTALLTTGFSAGTDKNGGEFYAMAPFDGLVSGDILNVCDVIAAADEVIDNQLAALQAAAAAAQADEDAAFAAYNAAVAACNADPLTCGDVPGAYTAWQAAVAASDAADNDLANAEGYSMQIPVTIYYALGNSPTCGGNDANMGTVYIDRVLSADFTDNGTPTICAGSTLTITPDNAGTTTINAGVGQTVMVSGNDFVIPTDWVGNYTITHTVTNGTCTTTEESIINVVALPSVTIPDAEVSVCSDALVNLNQFVQTPQGQAAGTFSGPGVIGLNVFDPNVAAASCPSCDGVYAITYTTGTTCVATGSFTITVISQATADLDIDGQICLDATVDLNDYLVSGATPGGNFIINYTNEACTDVTVAYDAAGTTYTFDCAGKVEVSYVVGDAQCDVTDGEIVWVIDDTFPLNVESYGFVCQSADDFSIDLTEYIDDGNQDPGNNNNGFNFIAGKVPAHITEIEYDASNPREFVELTAAEGTDLSCYALFFYERHEYGILAGTEGYFPPVTAGKSTGHVYGAFQLRGVVGSLQNGGNNTTNPSSSTADYIAGGFTVGGDGKIAGVSVPVDYISAGSGDLYAASNGISYGAIAYDPEFDIRTGPSAVALVNVCEALGVAPADLAYYTTEQISDLLWSMNYRQNNNVTQLVGYGIDPDGELGKTGSDAGKDDQTNLGIFTACNGPAAGMITMDLNVVDIDGANRSIGMTNTCWEQQGVTDAERNYCTTPGNRCYPSNPGLLNWGLHPDSQEEFYYDYIAPDGDILYMDRLCRTLFVVSQVVDTNIEPVDFTCGQPTYTLPFTYETMTDCGFVINATWNLTMLMDLDDRWGENHLYEDQIGKVTVAEAFCENDTLVLTELIDEEAQFIAPTEITGSFDTTIVVTLDENKRNPIISEIHYADYGYDASIDDHCVNYNYVNNNGTPFNNMDDTYATCSFCEGIELSGFTDSELSCYALVFYDDNSPNAGNGGSPANALMVDVTYIGPDGEPITTDVSEGKYMQLYGVFDDDQGTWYNQKHDLYTVPNFGPNPYKGMVCGTGYPWYAGIDPMGNPYGNVPGSGFVPGLYVDSNDNDAWDAGDLNVAATEFPWERPSECPAANRGSRWFPILNIPDNAAGVGIINVCSGEQVEFMSWGDANADDGGASTGADQYAPLCVEASEDFTLAGPFEQMSSTPIDTIQNSKNTLGDLRTLQRMSNSVIISLVPEAAACLEGDEDGETWVIVYNGGAFTIPGCNGVEYEGGEEIYEYSNSIGGYNCYMSPDAMGVPDEVELDLSNVDDIPNYTITTGHVINVTIGSDYDDAYSQTYEYTIGSDACKQPDTEVLFTQHHNTNDVTIIPGAGCADDDDDNNGIDDELEDYLDDPIDPMGDVDGTWIDVNGNGIFDVGTDIGYVFNGNTPWVDDADHNCVNADGVIETNPSVAGVTNDAGNNPVYNGSELDTYGYPAFNGWQDCSTPCIACKDDPNACMDGEFAPVMPNWTGNGTNIYGGSDSYLDYTVTDGLSDVRPISSGACYVGYCTELSKTRYFVRDLMAHLYNGNYNDTYQDGTITGDTCRTWAPMTEQYTVTINVHLDWVQCVPVGNFSADVPNWAPFNTPPVTLNMDSEDVPFWVFAPNGFAGDYSEIEVTYETGNGNNIIDAIKSDDLNCIDDDNETVRTKSIKIKPAQNAELSTDAISVCESAGVVDLSAYYAAGTSGIGTWSVEPASAGLSGASFNPATAGVGTYTVTYEIPSDNNYCGGSDAMTIEVTPGVSSAQIVGAPASICSDDAAITLVGNPAGGSFTINGAASDGTFDPALYSGDVAVSYTAGAGECSATATATITVVDATPIVVDGLTVTCNEDGTAYTVSFTISGGSGSYNMANPFVSDPIASGAPFSFNVDDIGNNCTDAVVVSDTPDPCPVACNAFAGVFGVFPPMANNLNDFVYCAEEQIKVDPFSLVGFNEGAGYANFFAITSEDGTIVALTDDGNFINGTENAGSFNVWVVNYHVGQVSAPSVGDNAGAWIEGDADNDCYAISQAFAITVLNPVSITATAECFASTEVGGVVYNGYLVQVCISGGAPEFYGSGAYDINWPKAGIENSSSIFSIDGGVSCAYITNIDGTAFPADAQVSINVSSDGHLCQGGPALVAIPSEPCGLAADNDAGESEQGQQINLNILANDNGTDIVVCGMQDIDPSIGEIEWFADGTFIFKPAPNFTGTVNVVYVVCDAIGQQETANITLFVKGGQGTNLLVEYDVICPPVGSSQVGTYDVDVNITSGTPPFSITGDFSATNYMSTMFSFEKADGESFNFTITDVNGNIYNVNEDVEPCAKTPVELVSFTGEVQDNGNFLTWTTASEIDNASFELQTSTDGIVFTTINEQAGQGTIATITNYNFLHANAPAGLSYYRLLSHDKNGQIHDAGTITLIRGEVAFGIVKLGPVPAKVDLTVGYTATQTSNINITVYDVAGKVVAVKVVDAVNGYNEVKLNVANYAAGTYYITLNNGTEVITNKFMKQ